MPAAQPAKQRGPVQPARVEADHDRRQGLQDPDATEQLEVDRELVGQRSTKISAPNFTSSETTLLCVASSLLVASGLMNAL